MEDIELIDDPVRFGMTGFVKSTSKSEFETNTERSLGLIKQGKKKSELSTHRFVIRSFSEMDLK